MKQLYAVQTKFSNLLLSDQNAVTYGRDNKVFITDVSNSIQPIDLDDNALYVDAMHSKLAIITASSKFYIYENMQLVLIKFELKSPCLLKFNTNASLIFIGSHHGHFYICDTNTLSIECIEPAGMTKSIIQVFWASPSIYFINSKDGISLVYDNFNCLKSFKLANVNPVHVKYTLGTNNIVMAASSIKSAEIITIDKSFQFSTSVLEFPEAYGIILDFTFTNNDSIIFLFDRPCLLHLSIVNGAKLASSKLPKDPQYSKVYHDGSDLHIIGSNSIYTCLETDFNKFSTFFTSSNRIITSNFSHNLIIVGTNEPCCHIFSCNLVFLTHSHLNSVINSTPDPSALAFYKIQYFPNNDISTRFIKSNPDVITLPSSIFPISNILIHKNIICAISLATLVSYNMKNKSFYPLITIDNIAHVSISDTHVCVLQSNNKLSLFSHNSPVLLTSLTNIKISHITNDFIICATSTRCMVYAISSNPALLFSFDIQDTDQIICHFPHLFFIKSNNKWYHVIPLLNKYFPISFDAILSILYANNENQFCAISLNFYHVFTINALNGTLTPILKCNNPSSIFPILFQNNYLISLVSSNLSLFQLPIANNGNNDTIESKYTHQMHLDKEELDSTHPRQYNNKSKYPTEYQLFQSIKQLITTHDINKSSLTTILHDLEQLNSSCKHKNEAISLCQFLTNPNKTPATEHTEYICRYLIHHHKYELAYSLYNKSSNFNKMANCALLANDMTMIINLIPYKVELVDTWSLSTALILNNDVSNAILMINQNEGYLDYLLMQYSKHPNTALLDGITAEYMQMTPYDVQIGINLSNLHLQHHLKHSTTTAIKVLIKCHQYTNALSMAILHELVVECFTMLLNMANLIDIDQLKELALIFKEHGQLQYAASFYLLSKDYKQAMLLFGELKQMDSMLMVVNKANSSEVTMACLGLIKGDPHAYLTITDVMHPYVTMNRVQDGYLVVNQLWEEYQKKGDYKTARSLIIQYKTACRGNKIQYNMDSALLLYLSQSYLSLKWLIVNKMELEAGMVLQWIVQHIEYYSTNKLSIMQSAMLQYQKIGMKKEAFEMAQKLLQGYDKDLKVEMRRKVEDIARKPTQNTIEVKRIGCLKCGEMQWIMGDKCAQCGILHEKCVLTLEIINEEALGCTVCGVHYKMGINLEKCVICEGQLE